MQTEKQAESFIHADEWREMDENGIIRSIDIGLTVLHEKATVNYQLPGIAREEVKMFRVKAWIPAEVEEDMRYTREAAEKEKAQLEEMQPENIYEIEEVDEV